MTDSHKTQTVKPVRIIGQCCNDCSCEEQDITKSVTIPEKRYQDLVAAEKERADLAEHLAATQLSYQEYRNRFYQMRNLVNDAFRRFENPGYFGSLDAVKFEDKA